MSDLQKGQIIGAFFFFMIMTAYTKHGKTSSAKKNSGQNLKVNDRANLNFHLEKPFSTKTDYAKLHKANIHERAASAKRLITDNNLMSAQRKCISWQCMIYSDGYIRIKWLCLRDVLSEKRSLASRQNVTAESGISYERKKKKKESENDFNKTDRETLG
uniref:Uncharacterized protein n=1 Tax=Sinocyclocheilus anshuiensis TaxID=1608454 RepID=A0A671MTF9_9TELE